MISISVTRATKVFDVTVIGGGTAGVFAAIAATRRASARHATKQDHGLPRRGYFLGNH